jgi:hypothetical protein
MEHRCILSKNLSRETQQALTFGQISEISQQFTRVVLGDGGLALLFPAINERFAFSLDKNVSKMYEMDIYLEKFFSSIYLTVNSLYLLCKLFLGTKR